MSTLMEIIAEEVAILDAWQVKRLPGLGQKRKYYAIAQIPVWDVYILEMGGIPQMENIGTTGTMEGFQRPTWSERMVEGPGQTDIWISTDPITKTQAPKK